MLSLSPIRPAAAAPSASELRYGSEVTVRLQPGDAILRAGRIGSDVLGGFAGSLDVGPLPAGAQVSSYHLRNDGSQLLSFASAVALPGAGTVQARDVVRYAPGEQSYTVVLRGADLDIPNGASIDALSEDLGGQILLSLDVSGVGADDEDLLRVSGGSLSLFFDGSAAGVGPDLDLDAAAVRLTALFLSFDGSSTVAGIGFNDEDVLAYDMVAHNWMLAYDGSAAAAAWPVGADLSAIDVLGAPPTAVATPTTTATHTPMATFTPTAVSTVTPTPIAPATFTHTAAPTLTSTPTVTESATPVTTDTPTPTATASATLGAAPCVGDCNEDAAVTVDEVVSMVNIALGNVAIDVCAAADGSGDGQVTVDEILTAVNRALEGCG